MAQSHLSIPHGFEGEVSRPSSFQRALENQVARRRAPARGEIRVLEAADHNPEMEQRVDELKQQMKTLSMDERTALMNQLRETDPALYEAVVRRITGRGKRVKEALNRVQEIDAATRQAESDIHRAVNSVAEDANAALNGLLKQA